MTGKAEVKEFNLKKKSENEYDLPQNHVFEIRALEAEVKNIKYESVAAIKEREDRKKEIIDNWVDLFKIKDIENWVIDLNNFKLVKTDA